MGLLQGVSRLLAEALLGLLLLAVLHRPLAWLPQTLLRLLQLTIALLNEALLGLLRPLRLLADPEIRRFSLWLPPRCILRSHHHVLLIEMRNASLQKLTDAL